MLHQLPPKPDYLRVKIRRRLAGLGAALVKNSVYVLPNNPESLEDFQWLRQEIEAANGSALIAEASFVEGISDEEIEAMLVAERVDAADERSLADSGARPRRVRTNVGDAPGRVRRPHSERLAHPTVHR